MAWLKVCFTCGPERAGELGALLEKFAAVSISYSAAAGEPVFADNGGSGPYWERTRVCGLFPEDLDTDILIACARNLPGGGELYDCRCSALQDQDWAARIRQDASAIVIGNTLCICPEWCESPPGMAHVVRLEPGLAFGSGRHATTRLCLQWLAGNDIRGRRVIDYGCGSGILALAAARLGAAGVFATDLDPQALQATRGNAVKNNLQKTIEIGYPDDDKLRPADILMANILLRPLLDLAEVFSKLVPAGGRIVLSGLLAAQQEQCLAAYAKWFAMQQPVYRDEWLLLSGVRKSETAAKPA